MNATRTLSMLLAAALLAACNAAAAAEELDSADGMEEGREWLALVDGARFADAWDAAAEAFRRNLTRDTWERAAVQARTGLGPLIARKLRTATHTRQLPGLPDAEYLVIQYDVRFERRPLAGESLVLEREKDNRWRVAGYSIK
jgi:hypothetical protein